MDDKNPYGPRDLNKTKAKGSFKLYPLFHMSLFNSIKTTVKKLFGDQHMLR